MSNLEWIFPRPALARKYLDLMQPGSGGPVILFSHRGTGKTTFLLKDVIPAAKKRRLLPIYIDLWKDPEAPAEVIVAALRAALGRLDPAAACRGPAARERTADAVTAWLDRLVAAQGGPVLLLIDQIHILASARDGGAIIQALRSPRASAGAQVSMLFTASLQHAQLPLLTRDGAPLHEIASQYGLPPLEREFVEFLAGRFAHSTQRELDVDVLWDAFVKLDRRPGELMDVLVSMVRDGATDTAAYLRKHLATMADRDGFDAQWAELKPIDQAVLLRLAVGEAAFSTQARQFYAEYLGVDQVAVATPQRAVASLLRDCILIAGAGRAHYAFENSAFEAWVKQHAPERDRS